MNTTAVVTRTASGKLNWASKEARNEAILAQLKRDGYTVKIPVERLGSKYFISRSASIVKRQLEKAFVTETQLNKYLREWNRYDHMYDSIDVVDRDYIIEKAARHILGS